MSPGTPATAARTWLWQLGLTIPGLLGERAAYSGLARNGPRSCGGAMRILPTADGQVALSLARESDVALVPALVESTRVAEPWDAVRSWASSVSTREAAARFNLLGLPGGEVGGPLRPGGPVVTTALGSRTVRERPLVVDLTSLWAGPLCAHLLGLMGARVVKVESLGRPDGARTGLPDFFDLLHGGHTQVTVDFASTEGRDTLSRLIADADLVLEASRPRALRQLGILADEAVARGTSWLSITACGRESNAVGFGDDIAARAGLVIDDDDGDLLPVGDAVADPLAGVRAALEASSALASAEARLIDLSMLDVVAQTVGSSPEHGLAGDGDHWWVETATGIHPVHPPERR